MLVVLALFFSLRRGRGVVMAVFGSALLWLTTFGYFIAAGLQDDWNILLAWRLASPAPEPAAASPAPRRALAASAGERPNVYHIVLDMMQTDAFLQVLERNSWHEEFNGFELFRNNIANYLVTVNSKASYLTGRLYDGSDLRDWRKSSWDGGVFEELEGAGYRISMYSPLERWNHPRTDSFVSNDDVYEARMGLKGSQAYDFFAIWLTSLAPNALTAEVLPLAERMSGPLFAAFGHFGRGGLHEQALSIRDGYTSYASVLLLQQLQLDEAARGDSGEFVYAHALLPHGPFVMDGRCRYVGRPGQRFRKVGARHAYLQQAECAAALVIRFLHELKESGRYEDSVIIIHADTGNSIVLSDRPTQKTVLGHSETKLLASVQALLMIKRPHTRGALRVDDKPSQLIDLFPTMLDILDLGPPAAELDGRSLYEAAPDEQHEARFSLDPDDAHGLNLVEVRIDDPLDIRNSSLTVLSNGADPAARQE